MINYYYSGAYQWPSAVGQVFYSCKKFKKININKTHILNKNYDRNESIDDYPTVLMFRVFYVIETLGHCWESHS